MSRHQRTKFGGWQVWQGGKLPLEYTLFNAIFRPPCCFRCTTRLVTHIFSSLLSAFIWELLFFFSSSSSSSPPPPPSFELLPSQALCKWVCMLVSQLEEQLWITKQEEEERKRAHDMAAAAAAAVVAVMDVSCYQRAIMPSCLTGKPASSFWFVPFPTHILSGEWMGKKKKEYIYKERVRMTKLKKKAVHWR